MAMLKSSIEGGIFGEGPVQSTRVRPTRDHDIFAPDHSPPSSVPALTPPLASFVPLCLSSPARIAATSSADSVCTRNITKSAGL